MNLPFYDDPTIASVLDFESTRSALDDAFGDLSIQRAEILARSRIDCGGVKLSVMGGIWLARNIAAVKTYPTLGGTFSFMVNVYDLTKNEPIAVLAGAELTRYRTAALVSLVASKSALPHSRKLALIGAGVQGRSIATALSQLFQFDAICVADPVLSPGTMDDLSAATGMQAMACSAEEAVRGADIVVTASRSKSPVFSGDWLKPGAFVAAVGTSLPDGRELDDVTLSRAHQVIVEWKGQSLLEAGEIVLGERSGALNAERIIDLCELYRGEYSWRHSDTDIVVFKSVGVGLADVATASVVVQRLCQNAQGAAL